MCAGRERWPPSLSLAAYIGDRPMDRKRLNRAFELVRARRFVALLQLRAYLPASMIRLPLDVDMRDVLFWMRRVVP